MFEPSLYETQASKSFVIRLRAFQSSTYMYHFHRHIQVISIRLTEYMPGSGALYTKVCS